MREPIHLQANIIERAQVGDTSAFAQLYDLFKGQVYRLCLLKTKNVPDAEDLTQEVFFRIYGKVGTFRGEAAFATWLHRVTINVILMHFRARRTVAVPLDQIPDQAGRASVGSERSNVAQSRPITRIALIRALRSLPKARRSAVVLHDVEGLTHAEIAHLLGGTCNTSKSQLFRARRQLRELLDGDKSH